MKLGLILSSAIMVTVIGSNISFAQTSAEKRVLERFESSIRTYAMIFATEMACSDLTNTLKPRITIKIQATLYGKVNSDRIGIIMDQAARDEASRVGPNCDNNVRKLHETMLERFKYDTVELRQAISEDR